MTATKASVIYGVCARQLEASSGELKRGDGVLVQELAKNHGQRIAEGMQMAEAPLLAAESVEDVVKTAALTATRLLVDDPEQDGVVQLGRHALTVLVDGMKQIQDRLQELTA